MRPFVLTADHHIHPFRDPSQDGGADRLADGLSATRQTLQYARAKKCTWVFCGDLKHVRGIWHQEALTGLLNVFEEFNDVPKVMLSGNGYHDGTGVKETGASGLVPFEKYATVISEPRLYIPGKQLRKDNLSLMMDGDDSIAVWPWNPSFDALPDFLQKFRVSKPFFGRRYLFGHGYLEGCEIGEEGRVLKDVGTPLREFGLIGKQKERTFDWAFFGDVHKMQYLGDKKQEKSAWVMYPGSPWAQNWGEREREKGCLYVDTAKGKVEFLSVSAPRFFVYEVEVPNDVKRLAQDADSNWGANDFVRVVVVTNLVRPVEMAITASPVVRILNIIPVRPKVRSDNSSKPSKSVSPATPIRDLMKAYVDTLDLEESNLDKEYLIKVGDSLLES